jgi:hypothetical protein
MTGPVDIGPPHARWAAAWTAATSWNWPSLVGSRARCESTSRRLFAVEVPLDPVPDPLHGLSSPALGVTASCRTRAKGGAFAALNHPFACAARSGLVDPSAFSDALAV